MDNLYPYLAGILGAASAWSLSHLQERNKSRALDLGYVRTLIDEQIEDLRAERDRNRADMVRLRERIAVLEANLQINTRDVARLRRENEILRRRNLELLTEVGRFKGDPRSNTKV